MTLSHPIPGEYGPSLTPQDMKDLRAELKRLEHELCSPMPYSDRRAASARYIALRDLEQAYV